MTSTLLSLTCHALKGKKHPFTPHECSPGVKKVRIRAAVRREPVVKPRRKGGRGEEIEGEGIEEGEGGLDFFKGMRWEVGRD